MKKIKIGILGAGRGVALAKVFLLLGAEIVAVCDFNEERMKIATEKLSAGFTCYDNFDDFIEHDMDAVVLANYFHEHAPFAIKCLERGIHVFSECISNGTMAEGVRLYDAAKKSGAIYMLAENYPFMVTNRELHRVYKSGTLGKILYAEGEYNHPTDPYDTSFRREYVYYTDHWRNHLPSSYYITHSLGPVMYSTGATPKKVMSFAAFSPTKEDAPSASYSGDKASIITTQNDDGSIFRITGCAGFGGHHNAYRICGTKGQVENLRGMHHKVMLRYNDWEKPEGKEEVNFYEAEWGEDGVEVFGKTGHGGGDYFCCREFLRAIEENRQPEFPFDYKSAIAMSSVAILAHRSMLEGGVPYDIPDFELPEDRARYENDYISPFYLADGTPPTIPCCSHTDFAPTEKQVALFKKQVLGIE